MFVCLYLDLFYSWWGKKKTGAGEILTVVTGRSGVARPRAVAGEGAPRLRAAAAVLAQVGEAPARRKHKKIQNLTLNSNSFALFKKKRKKKKFCSECSLAGDATLKSLLCLLKHKFNCVFCNQQERLEESGDLIIT